MKSLPIALLHPDLPPAFPDPARAMQVPNGLLAAGGALAPEWLLAAYARGIFPWSSAGEPILWWSPDPRCVFRSDRAHVSRRFRRQLRQLDWRIDTDRDFAAVIRACAAPRGGEAGTWITPAMIRAYERLHELGHAHSIEVRDAGGRLVGGLYGVSLGRLFCGESMFSRESGGSKVALLATLRVLHRRGWPILDAQVPNPHLLRMGAVLMPRTAFLDLAAGLVATTPGGNWREYWPRLHCSELAADAGA